MLGSIPHSQRATGLNEHPSFCLRKISKEKSHVFHRGYSFPKFQALNSNIKLVKGGLYSIAIGGFIYIHIRY